MTIEPSCTMKAKLYTPSVSVITLPDRCVGDPLASPPLTNGQRSMRNVTFVDQKVPVDGALHQLELLVECWENNLGSSFGGDDCMFDPKGVVGLSADSNFAKTTAGVVFVVRGAGAPISLCLSACLDVFILHARLRRPTLK